MLSRGILIGILGFGMVLGGATIGAVATGTGLNRVSSLLVASSAEGPPSHVAVRGAVGFACVGREL